MMFHIRDDLGNSTDMDESLWIEIQNNSNNRNIICGVIYRHPNRSLRLFLDDFYKKIDKIHKEGKECVFMGDLNINLLCYDSHSLTEEFVNTLSSYSFQPHILQPTRLTNYSATLIDNIFFNSLEYITHSRNILHDLSDHLPNFLIIDSIHSLPDNKQFKRDYSQLNKKALIDEFQKLDWDQKLSGEKDVNDIFSSFLSTSNDIINSYVLLKKLSRKEVKFRAKPWITTATSLNTKNRLYRKYLATRCEYQHAKYKRFRNKLKHLVNISKKKYYEEYFTHNRNNISYLPSPQSASFFISPTSTHEIGRIISELKPGKAYGPSSIPGPLIKLLNHLITKPLEILYNCSFTSGIVPDLFKIARVIPIFKAGSHVTLSNYRPISLLSIFNQILEQLMYNRLASFFTKCNTIYPGQFGFRANHSTEQALLLMTDKIQK